MPRFSELCLQLSQRVARALRQRRQDAIARRDLRWLDEHALRDIGLSHRAVAECLRGHPIDAVSRPRAARAGTVPVSCRSGA